MHPPPITEVACHPQAQTKRLETTSGPLKTLGRHPEMSPEPSESTVRQPEILSRHADISVKLSQVSVVVRSRLLHRSLTANIKYPKERETESKKKFREYLSDRKPQCVLIEMRFSCTVYHISLCIKSNMAGALRLVLYHSAHSQ